MNHSTTRCCFALAALALASAPLAAQGRTEQFYRSCGNSDLGADAFGRASMRRAQAGHTTTIGGSVDVRGTLTRFADRRPVGRIYSAFSSSKSALEPFSRRYGSLAIDLHGKRVQYSSANDTSFRRSVFLMVTKYEEREKVNVGLAKFTFELSTTAGAKLDTTYAYTSSACNTFAHAKANVWGWGSTDADRRILGCGEWRTTSEWLPNQLVELLASGSESRISGWADVSVGTTMLQIRRRHYALIPCPFPIPMKVRDWLSMNLVVSGLKKRLLSL